ncbi:uncharacterized protein LOC143038363 [Oratosquilla oratoria]|uniref:uncharacterized protein LOC143038363 n=1 Tax=Oratosquilla oratoria TaxID=337810 RepID=UPI003F774205
MAKKQLQERHPNNNKSHLMPRMCVSAETKPGPSARRRLAVTKDVTLTLCGTPGLPGTLVPPTSTLSAMHALVLIALVAAAQAAPPFVFVLPEGSQQGQVDLSKLEAVFKQHGLIPAAQPNLNVIPTSADVKASEDPVPVVEEAAPAADEAAPAAEEPAPAAAEAAPAAEQAAPAADEAAPAAEEAAPAAEEAAPAVEEAAPAADEAAPAAEEAAPAAEGAAPAADEAAPAAEEAAPAAEEAAPAADEAAPAAEQAAPAAVEAAPAAEEAAPAAEEAAPAADEAAPPAPIAADPEPMPSETIVLGVAEAPAVEVVAVDVAPADPAPAEVPVVVGEPALAPIEVVATPTAAPAPVDPLSGLDARFHHLVYPNDAPEIVAAKIKLFNLQAPFHPTSVVAEPVA